MDERIIGTRELAKRFNVTPRTVRNWQYGGEVQGIRVAGRWLFPVEEVERIAERRTSRN